MMRSPAPADRERRLPGRCRGAAVPAGFQRGASRAEGAVPARGLRGAGFEELGVLPPVPTTATESEAPCGEPLPPSNREGNQTATPKRPASTPAAKIRVVTRIYREG